MNASLLDLVPAAASFDAAEPDPQADVSVSAKQLLRWQDDGGALPPGV